MNTEQLSNKIKELQSEIEKIEERCSEPSSEMFLLRERKDLIHINHSNNIKKLKVLETELIKILAEGTNTSNIISKISKLKTLTSIKPSAVINYINSHINELHEKIRVIRKATRPLEQQIKKLTVAIELREKIDNNQPFNRACEDMIDHRKMTIYETEEYQELIS